MGQDRSGCRPTAHQALGERIGVPRSSSSRRGYNSRSYRNLCIPIHRRRLIDLLRLERLEEDLFVARAMTSARSVFGGQSSDGHIRRS